MNDETDRQKAMMLVDQAYRLQMKGEFADAIVVYNRSIEIWPTAEAYTFLGWTYSMMNRYDEAIENCKKAIEIDPAFGNPYNDIGSYLIEQGQWEEAIPWLEKAITAERYESPHFAYLNMGRAYEKLGRFKTALDQFDKAILHDPFYRAAIWAKHQLLGHMN
jgi:tetratricopeptide (TPR) repeat protein